MEPGRQAPASVERITLFGSSSLTAALLLREIHQNFLWAFYILAALTCFCESVKMMKIVMIDDRLIDD